MLLNQYNTIYSNNISYSKHGAYARKYLKDRKISDKTIEDFQLGFCFGNDHIKMIKEGFTYKQLIESRMVNESKDGVFYDVFYNRITIPLFLEGEIKTFTSRSVEDSPIPHLHRAGRFSIAFNHNVLFKGNHVIITESPIDTMTLHSYGYPSIALLGANKITRRVLSDLSGLTVYICFDYDPINRSGQKKAKILAQKLINNNIPSRICDFTSICGFKPKEKIDANSFFKTQEHKDFNKVISKSREFFGKKEEEKRFYDTSTEDIVSLISQYTEVMQTGDKFMCICPLHKDSKPSMVIYKNSNSWYCFGCSVGGGVSRFKKLIGHYEPVG